MSTMSPLPPRRNFKGDAAPYTRADDALLIEARTLAFTWNQIAILLSRPPGDAVRRRWVKLQERAQEARRVANLRQRACMCCHAMFGSEGSHNRMCDPCREGRSENPFEPFCDWAEVLADELTPGCPGV